MNVAFGIVVLETSAWPNGGDDFSHALENSIGLYRRLPEAWPVAGSLGNMKILMSTPPDLIGTSQATDRVAHR